MDWVIENIGWLMALMVAAMVGAEFPVAWKQLRPKNLHYTWPGVLQALISAGMVLSLVLVYLAGRNSAGIPAPLSIVTKLFVASTGIAMCFAAIGAAFLYAANRRISAIEAHLFSRSTSGRSPPPPDPR